MMFIRCIFLVSVFGLGTLIFTGLEIAMHATMETNCVEDIVIAHPILQALFTFLQMHFLFVNSQVIKLHHFYNVFDSLNEFDTCLEICSILSYFIGNCGKIRIVC